MGKFRKLCNYAQVDGSGAKPPNVAKLLKS